MGLHRNDGDTCKNGMRPVRKMAFGLGFLMPECVLLSEGRSVMILRPPYSRSVNLLCFQKEHPFPKIRLSFQTCEVARGGHVNCSAQLISYDDSL